ncbi:MAG: endolytic transglycosylase MltG [Alphaproteobacteria bacterium]
MMQKNIFLFSKKILILQSLVVILVVLLCGLFGNLPINKEISIPRGATLDTIATLLKTNGVVRSRIGFKLLSYTTGRQNNLKAGDYRFKGRVSSLAVLDDIFAGRSIEEILVMIEGWTVKKTLLSMETAPYLKGDVTNIPPEGSLLPNSYSYHRNSQKQELIDRMTKAMVRAVDEAWAMRDDSLLPYIKNKKDFVIFASLVERETRIKSEKPRIAGVFINRLQKGMRLETDPTVIYGLSDRLGELNRKLYIKDLKKKSPWNTYTIYGLPLTAIANPSRETLLAVARPEKNNYFFFVANDSGGHAFATNFADHQKNIDKFIRKK